MGSSLGAPCQHCLFLMKNERLGAHVALWVGFGGALELGRRVLSWQADLSGELTAAVQFAIQGSED